MPPNIILISPHDDQLAVNASSSILMGDWLGDWNVTTLLKSPFYSIFLAVSKLIGISPLILTHILILVIQYLLAGALVKLLKIKKKYFHSFEFLIYLFLSLNPALFTSDFSRVYRISLTTLLVMSIFLIGLKINLTIYEENRGLFSKKLFVLYSMFGFTSGLAIITRDDSIPFVAVFTTLILIAISYKCFRSNLSLHVKLFTKMLIIPLTILVSMVVPIASISIANEFKYGFFGVNDYSQGYFSKSIKAWADVDNGRDARNGILISEGQRQAVYEISPTAKRLESGLSFEPGQGWKGPMCQTTGICDEFGAAWIPFAIRDAAASAAGLNSERNFQFFFKQIFQDISRACESGRLSCSKTSSATGLLNLRDGTRSGLFSYSLKFGSSFLVPWQTNKFEVFQNQNISPEVLNSWKSGTGLEPSATSTSSNLKQLRFFLELLSLIYGVIVPVLFLLSVISLVLNSWLRSHALVTLVQFALLLSLLSFLILYGLISASWGFLAEVSLYGAIAQPLFLIFILIGSIGLYKRFRT